ncbi:MAG: WD40/YVTN/BNR-like repeat-containing protein, partial [Candidatus Rokuibacteriota bacterium]
MANASGTSHVYVGTAARVPGAVSGIFRQTVGSDQWERLGKGLPERMDVQAITIHPTDSSLIFAGSQDGPYRSRDGGASWEKLPFPDGGLEVWSILIHPRDPRTMYLGTSPVAVYRSDNGGDSWRKLPRVASPGRVKMNFPCRVTRLAIDPSSPDEIYAGLEVDGVLRSQDRGETWEDIGDDLVKLAERPHLKSRIASDTENEGMLDTHALTVSSALPGT